MNMENTVGDWEGKTLFDQDGGKIGTIETVYTDTGTNKPEWALVHTGLFGMKHNFVPLAGATSNESGFRVPFTKDVISSAPNVGNDEELSEQEEARLFEHYGIPYGGETVTAQGTGGAGVDDTARRDVDRGDQGTVRRHEEELTVGKVRRPSELVRLNKRVETEPVSTNVGLEHEDVRIERQPLDERATAGQHEFGEQQHEVVLHHEEPVVEKQVVAKEQVSVEKDVRREDREVTDDVRKERIDVEREGGVEGRTAGETDLGGRGTTDDEQRRL
ncbi:MAG: DUF2382 domain-containing protein [Candidatus Dormibacteraeota bacterium]|uniref:DUF2382 domain-containing protein n=1 Tax=Candidatus Dormiibacter inghamiae TaxID=3127013 RepID=A0A934KJB0_9BACT|nr:DUF2382 domain-containing protein [Candidatus Dormibacteraeota bacterium]MBJ7606953.1 DUF2382 domain-containing protein [Candidatus Dormibacteraeota bacterium]